jgi:hypothetical protein
MSSFRRLFPFAGAGTGLALLVLLFATCSSNDPDSPCPTPAAGTNGAGFLAEARAQASFPVLFPCQLPAGQTLTGTSVQGDPGRQQAELVFDGPFDLTLRQSQYPPPLAADPTGASRIVVDLFPNVRGTLVEINDGSRRAQYHLFWERNGLFYEVQAVGPPLQRRFILLIATSLEESPGVAPANAPRVQ